jgi:hypothetical protein
LFSLGFIGIKKFIFFDIGGEKGTSRPIRNSQVIFSSEIYLDAVIVIHNRTVFGIMDLLGEIGGNV